MNYPPLKSGIYELMNDLDKGINDPDTLMLGGGTPSILEATHRYFSPWLKKIADHPKLFCKAFQNYTHPQGEDSFIETIVTYLKKKTGWSLTRDQVVTTLGSQQGFYMLYNYLIGKFHPPAHGLNPKLVMVKVPDYIGYFDLIPQEYFLSVNGKINLEEKGFYYSIDFPALEALLDKDGKDYQIKALVISSPNNPSSHSLSQADIDKLCELAKAHDKLIVFDHAYGFPFPNIVFEEQAHYPLTTNTLHCFSFSKIGFPGIRTGVMVGSPDLIEKITILNGIINLAPSSFTCAFLKEILPSPDFDVYIKEFLYPHYATRKNSAVALLKEKIKDTPGMLHRPQGGFFLWLRLPNFPLSSYQLYQEIKSQKVVVVPGNYFFLNQPQNEAYLRISYTMEENQVLQGLNTIGEVVKKHYQKQTKP